MNNPVTFSCGGIHPSESKFYTKDIPIKNAPVPSIAIIPMAQHMGRPAECLVNIGDELKEGMLIGKATGFFSANIHSPIPGKVVDIKELYLTNGIRSMAVIAELSGEFDRSGKNNTMLSWDHLSKKNLIDKIADMGIVGLGGATFPTHIKYTVKKGTRVKYFIVNGVECEPYLTADYRLMLEKTEEILEGVKIIKKILSPEQIFFGIEDNKPDAIAKIERVISRLKMGIEVVPLKTQYPQGDEKQLIKAITGMEVPSLGLPIDVGTIVSNVGSVFAIYEAVVYDKPLIERIVTVTGSIIKRPANFKVRIGMRVSELLEECGGLTETPVKIIAGGPLMGNSFYGIDTPITKGISGIVALSKKEAKQAAVTTCIRCGKCIRSCPVSLNPTLLYRLIVYSKYEEAKHNGLLDCRECGCCGYVCPAWIPLVQGMKLGKYMLKKKGLLQN